MKRMFEKWNIHRLFRAAYRPGGNGIVERNHRTIKAIAEKGNITPEEAVFFFCLVLSESRPRVTQNQKTKKKPASIAVLQKKNRISGKEDQFSRASVLILLF